jgi:5-methylcytosine-specific restriction endonuclease McrA
VWSWSLWCTVSSRRRLPSNKTPQDTSKLDRIVAEARRNRELREQDYREQALKIYPWVCARCAREFTRANLQQLTVHHKDHNHDNNPPDGSNWELLCIYCHDNEHSRHLDSAGRGEATRGEQDAPSTFKAFADLKARLKSKDQT